jgi:nucleoside-diphosphate-sugar epimerase
MILVTGGTGFLGSHLLQTLTGSGRVIRCIYRKSIPPTTIKCIDWRQADLLDVASIEDALEGVDQVFHCAGVVSFNPADRKRMYAVNIAGTANLVNACITNKISRLVHVSSVAALGRSGPDKIIDESCQWEDSRHNTAYARTKHEGEIEVWRGIGEGLDAVIVNPSILIGPSASWNDASATLIKNNYEGFPWYTKGVNGFVGVQDVARALIRLMESDIHAERFILNGDNWSYQRLFSVINHYLGKKTIQKYAAPWMGELIWRIEKIRSSITGKPPKVTHDMARTASLKVYYDNSKIKRFLPGFEFTPLENTIADTCRAFLQYITLQQGKEASSHSSHHQ